MKKKSERILLIVFICTGLASVLLICFGFIAKNSMDRSTEAKQYKLQMDLYAVGNVYLESGAGEEARRAIDTFLSNIPANLKENNNVVIVDKSGVIRLKANSKFLHTESNELTMAWDSYAVIFDNDGHTKHWIQSTGESIAESDSGYVRTVGASRMGLNQFELRSMIHDYWKNVNEVEAEVEISYIGDQKNPMYLFWFSDLGVHNKIYEYLGLNAGLYFMNFVYAGKLLLLLFWLLAPVWVFLDARRRQTRPLPWALLTLLTNVVGLVVYWIVQTQDTKLSTALACPACGRVVQKNHLYCPWCAAPLVKSCKGCGKALEKQWVACPWCGKTAE